MIDIVTRKTCEPVRTGRKSLWLASGLILALSSCSYVNSAKESAGIGSGDAQPSAVAQPSGDIERAVLAPNDGWASFGDGTTGGSDAADENVLTVSSRKALVDAFALGDVPKIIRIEGTINLSSDDQGRALEEADYTDPEFNWGEYIETYRPAVWNIQEVVKGRPPKLTGPLEEARQRSADVQAAVVVVKVPSNTTLVGIGSDAKIINGNLIIGKGVSNVIIRNIGFEDSFDYFPGWSPRDSFKIADDVQGCQETYESATRGPQMCEGGRWNAEYDLITISGATHVWIDHCTFSDGAREDKLFPPIFPAPHNEPEQKVQHHDGLIDVISQANYITISNNVFKNHDKAHVIGNSDKKTEDLDHLKVTMRHNLFENIKQRTPRVRFGEVHVYNNYFRGQAGGGDNPFSYAFGIGTESRLVAESNVFDISGDIEPEKLIGHYRGSVAQVTDTLLNGDSVDVVESFVASTPDKALGADVGWTPSLYAQPALPVGDVADYVLANAGAGKL